MESTIKIIDSVCKYYNIDECLIQSKSRKPNVVQARHIIQYLLKMELKLTYKHIAFLFKRKHPTIIYAINNIESQLTNKFDFTIQNDISKLKKLINNN